MLKILHLSFYTDFSNLNIFISNPREKHQQNELTGPYSSLMTKNLTYCKRVSMLNNTVEIAGNFSILKWKWLCVFTSSGLNIIA